MAADNDVTWLTQEAFDRRTAELEQLTGEARYEIEEQGKIEARIRVLTQLLRHAVVGDVQDDDGVVEPGILVTAKIMGDESVFLLGSREIVADDSDLDVYSEKSPLGLAINGMKVGESTTYTAPNGKAITVEIVKIATYSG